MANSKKNVKSNAKSQKKPNNVANKNKDNTQVKSIETKKSKNLDDTNLDIIIDDKRLTDTESLDVSFIDGKSKKKKAAEAIKKLEKDVNYKMIDEDDEKFCKHKGDFLSTLFIIIFSLILGFLGCYIWAKETGIFVVKEKVVEKEIVIDDNFVFVGDSIFEGYDLDKYYENMPVVNSGISGHKTTDILKDMENRIYEYNPSKVILMIGTNDLLDNITSEQTVENIGKIIDGIKENRPYAEIYVQSIYPINNSDAEKVKKWMVGDRNNEDISKMNSEIRKVCKEKKVTYMNVYDLLTDEDDNLKIDYTSDGLHISDEGYKIITAEVMKVLNKK